MKSIRKNIEIRRFLEWSKIVRGKPIQIRLYELIYFELLELWLDTNKPPLRKLIYETINSNNYDEKFIKGNIFQEYIEVSNLTEANIRKFGIHVEICILAAPTIGPQ